MSEDHIRIALTNQSSISIDVETRAPMHRVSSIDFYSSTNKSDTSMHECTISSSATFHLDDTYYQDK